MVREPIGGIPGSLVFIHLEGAAMLDQDNTSVATQPKSQKRGFAAMDPAKQREIARRGGRAAHESGNAHEFSSQEAAVAGKKGGASISKNREHMSLIGKKGGQSGGKSRISEAMPAGAES